MSNPIFQALNKNPYSDLISQARQLRNQIKNPRKEVQQLLNSGKISQEQLNNAMAFAQNLIQGNPSSFN